MSISSKFVLLLPSFGFLVFVLLFLLASFHYPGGSIFDKSTTGFDWIYNFWCDLMRSPAYNGMMNSYKSIGVSAMFVLCSSFIGLFILFPRLFPVHHYTHFTRILTCLDIMVCAFVFTSYHEQIIWIGGILSIIPISWTFYHLYINREWLLLYTGTIVASLLILCFVLFALDRMWFLLPLPLIEKFALLALLLWAMLVNHRIARTLQKDHELMR